LQLFKRLNHDVSYKRFYYFDNSQTKVKQEEQIKPPLVCISELSPHLMILSNSFIQWKCVTH